MYALTDTAFGGYVTRMIPPRGGGRGGGGGGGGPAGEEDVDVDDWDEETVAWSDYADGRDGGRGDGGASRFLPDDDSGAWARDEATGEWTRAPRNPELARFGPAAANSWVRADVTGAVANFMALANDDADGDGIVEIAAGSRGSSPLAMSLAISTDSSDGVIYASKEDWGGNGPYLELRFALGGVGVVVARDAAADDDDGDGGAGANGANAATGPPSLSPAPSISPPPATYAPAAPLVRPFKPEMGGGIDEMTPKEEGERAETEPRANRPFSFFDSSISPPPTSETDLRFFSVVRLFLFPFFFLSPPPFSIPSPDSGRQYHLRRILVLPDDHNRHRDRSSSSSSRPSTPPPSRRR